MRYIIPLITLCIFLLIGAGCEQQPITGATIKELGEEIICNSPYIRYAETCCLDKNSNNMCDEDETNQEKIPQPQETTTIKDSCTDTTYFDCWGSYITKNEILLRLKAKRDGYNIIRKIEFPSIGCKKEFEPIPKDQGLEIREIIEIKIPCKISTTYFKDLTYNVESIYYPASGDTTEWLGGTRGLIISSGTISGTVLEKPPEII